MKQQLFGTDGIRGKVGRAPISADCFLKLGWAVGRVLAKTQQGKVVIGKDTRISGYMFESALEAGLVAAGMDVCLLGPMPTPGIAYLTRTLQADAGIVISASHNSYEDNGVKFFAPQGSKLSDAQELAIERLLDAPLETVCCEQLGRAQRLSDAPGRYVEFCKSAFPSHLNLKGLKVVVDCANGACYQVAPIIFAELGASVTTVADQPDGFNINNRCGSTAPETLAKKVLSTGADIGIALDGDGDRAILVDNTGRIIDGDEMLLIIAKYYQQQNKAFGGVAGTVMSNLGLEQALHAANIPFCRTQVGDRHVMAACRARNWLLGGESSGHILCLDIHSTGDGIISALQVIAAMISQNASLFELTQHMEKFPQILLNVPVSARQGSVLESASVQNAVSSAESHLKARHGRVLLRASGTEPVIRVMVEGRDKQLVQSTANELAEVVAKAHQTS